ncbi:peptidase E, partial [Lactococcus lactis subsp. lactis]
LEKYVAPVPKKSMTMKERIDKAKTKLSEKKPQETELKNDKLSNNKIKGENEL